MARKEKKAGGTLQDQLRKVGLVNDKQLNRARKGQHKKSMQLKHEQLIDEDKAAAKQVLADKAARDRQQNLEREQQALQKALLAQIRQLVKTHSKLEAGDIPYNFVEDKKVKKIYVSATNQHQLNKGYLAIVKTRDGYDLVPEKVAHKIMARRDDVVLYLFERAQSQIDDDDPYKDFQIPDDLEW